MSSSEGWDEDVAEPKAPTIAKPEDTPVVQSAGKPHVAEKADPNEDVNVRIKAGASIESLSAHGITLTDEYTPVPKGKLSLLTRAAAAHGVTLERE